MNQQSPSDKRILMMAGGTGGHVFPALAIARELQDRGVDIQWLGTEKGIESRLVPEADIPLHTIGISGFRGKGIFAKLLAPVRIGLAILQSLSIIRQLKPNVVMGLGGFASGPGGVAAKMLGIPLLIHEQNAVAGTTNRLLQKIANRVFEAFSGSLPGAETVGNPVRKEIIALERQPLSNEGRLNLLVLGGSQGALALNEMLPESLALLPEDIRPHVCHQTGKNQKDKVEAAYKTNSVSAGIFEFITDMASAYQKADLVVCRSGALTVAELLAVGLPAIYVPYPHAIDDHQTKNADSVVQQGGGLLRVQHELTAEMLAKDLQELLENRDKLNEMANAVKKLAILDAADHMADACMEKMK